MRLMLVTSIFLAGVYLGLHSDPEGELARTMEQIQALFEGEPEW